MGRSRVPRPLLWLLVAALLAFGVFTVMAWRATTLETLDASSAAERLSEVRASFGGLRPLLVRDEQGHLVRAVDAPEQGGGEPDQLVVLVHNPADGTFLRVEVPFWFLLMKAPALRMVLSGTGFDIEDLGITPTDLRAYGTCPLIDETRADGTALLVWTR